jgi:zinc transport system permease protein
MVIISFDEAYAKLLGINIGRFQFVSTFILALVVSLSIATVGVLLVSSLMIIPVAAAMKVGKSFKNTIGIAILFSEISIIGGLWLSYELRIASGATIVLINIVILLLVGLFRRFFLNKRLKKQQPELNT